MSPDHRADPGQDPDEQSPTPTRPPLSASWRTVRRALAPRATRAQGMAGLLCALLGFALVVQVQQTRTDGLTNLRQDELVRILDDVTQRSEELTAQANALRSERNELVSGSDTQRTAREAAAQRAEVQGILAGRLPAQGPGIELVIVEREGSIPALTMHNVLEELRNAGAEAVQLNDLRLTAQSYFVDVPDGLVVDGTLLSPPYRWLAIGDPATLSGALGIRGGALATVRNAGGATNLDSRDLVEVAATKAISAPRFATPVPVAETDE
ncbi:DUF881 domain-containing protein [Actinotalea sp. K2]|uniref:DUF881 domain-containing protein n=1 Tax=Actinotalea sp. K2 TaxID=2939438 RepID=UPI002016DA96|nr:DUF881 domain-containing protein [Actinotalea sp. K2]MCL3862416.1 DUF881 domain-containing protein [Actinotalea sp. K2]